MTVTTKAASRAAAPKPGAKAPAPKIEDPKGTPEEPTLEGGTKAENKEAPKGENKETPEGEKKEEPKPPALPALVVADETIVKEFKKRNTAPSKLLEYMKLAAANPGTVYSLPVSDEWPAKLILSHLKKAAEELGVTYGKYDKSANPKLKAVGFVVKSSVVKPEDEGKSEGEAEKKSAEGEEPTSAETKLTVNSAYGKQNEEKKEEGTPDNPR